MMKNILFFGDSLTAGYGLLNANAESFPALIGNRLKDEGLAYDVINAGLSGDTTAGGLARLDYWLNKPVDIFVLELGINDIRRGVPPQQIAKNLHLIVEQVKNSYRNVKLVLLGMEIPFMLGGPIAEAFNALYRNVAQVHKMAFVPFLLKGVAGQQHLNLWDRLHPSAEGYKVVAETVWPVLRSVL